MKFAVITLSPQGGRLMEMIRDACPGTDCYLHDKVEGEYNAQRFARVVDLTADIFTRYEGLVYIAPAGAVVRALAGNIKSKKTDPAVVQMDVGGRWAVSLLSGHEGGANGLAVTVANAVGAEPVISTSTEAAKDLIVGVGCRRDTKADDIVHAVTAALKEAELPLERVRLLASAEVKKNETGLIEAAEQLGLPLVFVPSDDIRNSARNFEESDFVKQKVNLPAVAEPSALLAGRRTQLVLKKKTFPGITVAAARENCSSLA